MEINGHNHTDLSQKCHDYIKGLEEERRKIQVFQRELPLCLDLVTQAIETCKQQLSSSEYNIQGQLSECSEQISSVVPVFEEFIPIKMASFDSDGEEQESKKFKIETSYNLCNKDGEDDSSDQNCKKSEWLRSVQLWNQSPDPISKEVSPSKFAGTDLKLNDGGAFHSFKKEKSGSAAAPPPSTSCTAETGGGNKKEGQSQRKTRRSWSPELHRRFLQALKDLGGPNATPKQIRDLMKVDGLTNDEVKSHLQKYRLHTRRPSPSTPNNHPQTPQFVVLGGIWVPPEYAAMATTTTSAEESGGADFKKIYAPIAAPPPPSQEPPQSPKQIQHIIKQSSHSDSYSKGAGKSCSPASSSSAHMAAVSPAC